MRTLVDLPDADLAALTELSRGERTSRAALIREAVKDFLVRRRPPEDDLMEFFGLWGEGEDGVDLQRRLRDEWSERS